MSPSRHEREARRARSSRSFTAREERRGRSSGHPALFVEYPLVEYEDMPQGGAYPHGFIARAAQLIGCPDPSAIVHLCSGSVRGALTFDYRAEAGPSVVADVRWLPIRPGSIRWALIDPPYGADYAEHLWDLAAVYPTPTVIMRELVVALAIGGRAGFLHQLIPNLPDGLRRVSTHAIGTGPGYRLRAFTVVERTHDAEPLFG